MINVCFSGITGWTAPPIVAAIDEATDLTLSAGVARSAAGQDLTEVAGSSATGQVHGSVAEALRGAEVDVLVDYTSANAVRDHVFTAVEAGVHVVVGSSGLAADDYEQLDQLAQERGVGVVAAGNFSVMAALLRRAAATAATRLNQWEIIDYAKAEKNDVPSGTSRELAETLGQVHPPDPAVAPQELNGPAEARGTEVAGTRVHSVRLPGFVVSTEVVFGKPGEKLIMRHDPGSSPEPYAEGTLLAIRKVADTAGVRRGLDSLLFADDTNRR